MAIDYKARYEALKEAVREHMRTFEEIGGTAIAHDGYDHSLMQTCSVCRELAE